MVLEKPGSDNKTNIGLCMKFEAKAQKVLGLTQKSESGWEYSFEAVKLIEEYLVSGFCFCFFFPELVLPL
jgi:hypothetical protein